MAFSKKPVSEATHPMRHFYSLFPLGISLLASAALTPAPALLAAFYFCSLEERSSIFEHGYIFVFFFITAVCLGKKGNLKAESYTTNLAESPLP